MFKLANGHRAAGIAVLCALQASLAHAISFSLPWGDGEAIEGVLNSTIVIGAAMRTQDRHTDYLGKANSTPTSAAVSIRPARVCFAIRAIRRSR
ncbi:hypothetical protein SAMN04488120_11070 [Fontimonas thermophila]|uniref:Uncharacterized protein n=1 Tax=Fontimonas thermophila TaxID=1076937 RepID=A0A1I2JWE0_9GAMM|nr:DUF1302 family protein [Fontimonas thermophila]SFF58509.1 hypothetical protein SAMN04488120_11070 [Fontimonas thermophila]